MAAGTAAGRPRVARRTAAPERAPGRPAGSGRSRLALAAVPSQPGHRTVARGPPPRPATPPPRRSPHTDVRSRYQVFLRDDAHLRRLKAQGDTDAAAVELTAVARGDIAFDLWDFATTLDALAGRQLAEFTPHAADASGALGGWPAVPAGALGAAGLLVLPAILPRLAEYR